MRLSRALLCILGALPAGAVSACSSLLGDFDVAGSALGPDGGDGGSGADVTQGPDGTREETGSDGADAGTCQTATCADPSTLNACDGTRQACTFGCVTTGGAHCAIIYPSPPVLPSDLTTAGVTDISLAQNTQFHTDTGAIDNLRAPNGDPLTVEVNSGIGFHIADDGAGHKVAVWAWKSLTVPTGITVRFTSAYAAALVAATTLTVVGVLDARGYDSTGNLCNGTVAGPGGAAGGATTANGQGPGGGLTPQNAGSTYSGGPSGGSYGAGGGSGGHGANAATQPGASAAMPYGTPALQPILGGSGGGGSGGASGGGGGGAIQLVAGTKIVLGSGTNPGGLNAGGCNGHGAAFGAAGSAAGSGGAILVETPSLDMQPNGVLAANGGAGATGGGAADPPPGQLSSATAYGAIGSGGYGSGGWAGLGTSPAGGNGTPSTSSSGAGGAGGGAAGRIRINNRSGSFTPGNGAVVTPALGITPNPPASVGTLDVH